MRKPPEAFRSIGEAADELGVPKHVLRFWESKFPQIKPMRRSGGRRLYRPTDMALLRRVHQLLRIDGYTVRGARRRLQDRVMP